MASSYLAAWYALSKDWPSRDGLILGYCKVATTIFGLSDAEARSKHLTYETAWLETIGRVATNNRAGCLGAVLLLVGIGCSLVIAL